MSRSGPRRRVLAGVAVASVAALTLSLPTGAVAKQDKAKQSKATPNEAAVQLLSFNDFHGRLFEDTGSAALLSAAQDPSRTPAGGVEHLATTLKTLRADHGGASLTVAAGDLIGGSTFISGLFHDEPTVESMDSLGLDVSSVGNHEFDEGTAELLRIQNGGCHPKDGCYFEDSPYAGADYQYLAANVVKKADNQPLLPAYEVRQVAGVKVGFIGMTLEATRTLVSPDGVASVDFKDEVVTANKYARVLKKQGVKAIVVLLHEGGNQSGTYQECVGISGPIVDIASQLDPEIDEVITGHTHQPYVCNIPDPEGQPRLVTSAASYGKVVTESTLVVNTKSGQVKRAKSTATNHLVPQSNAKDADQTAIIEKWNAISAPIAGRVVGSVTEDITGDSNGNRGIETAMANLVADSILYSTSGDKGGAQIGFTNVSGTRDSLRYNQISNGEQPGEVTYQEAYNVLPFGNLLTSMDLTGDQIRQILEQQYQPVADRGSRPMLALGVSDGFTYSWDATQPQGSRVVPGSMQLNGTPISMTTTYRVGTLSFLAAGGDVFTVFKQGQNVLGGAEDIEGFVDFMQAKSPVSSPGADRVNGL